MATANAAPAVELNEEQKNIRNLVRIVGSFIAWPALSISLVFMLDLDEHLLHVAGLFPLGMIGLLMVFLAPKIAARFAQDE